MYFYFFKRVIDIFLSFLSLLILSPLFLIVGLLVKLDSSGPVFFFQTRMGKNGNIFQVYKFRTMTNKKREVNEEIFKGNPDVTRVGNYLRRFKIDELPQLLNVLKGDMSIVGPRPGIPEMIKDMNDEEKKRLTVSPGLTGLAQVNGNIYLSWQERWKYDIYYVENISFRLDIKIIFKTFHILLKGEENFIQTPD